MCHDLNYTGVAVGVESASAWASASDWSPDGSQLVMFGGSRSNPQLFVTDASGQHPRQLTDRGGVNLDPSFTADGGSVLFVGCPQAECYPDDQEIYRIDTAGLAAVRLTFDHLPDHDPYQSPLGDRIAWLTQFSSAGMGVWDVRVGDAAAADPHRLINDDGVTSRPQWSPDGRRVLVHRIPPGGARFGLYTVAVDNGGVTSLTDDQPGSNEYPTN
jgi:TolB protein